MKRLAHIALLLAAMIISTTAIHAQCGIKNTAFMAGEELSYQLYFNWKFVWIKAGTANMKITGSNYGGFDGYKCTLRTHGSPRTDRYFMMRDTLDCYVKEDCTPLYYRKGALEGKRFNIDEVWYKYPGDGTVFLKQRYTNHKGEVRDKSYTAQVCVFDMLSMILRARSFDPSRYVKGQIIKFPMCDGDDVTQAHVVFRGKKVFKMEDTGVKYNCLVFSFVEEEGKKEKEVVTFYITDDMNHMPVRLDLYLNFGTAKAYLTKAVNLRNPQTSIVQ